MYKPVQKSTFRRKPLVVKIQKHSRTKSKKSKLQEIWSTIRPSAFRAIGASNSIVTIAKTESITKIPFPNVQFDLCGEYDPVHSVFIPKTSGVYSIKSFIAVNPLNTTVNYAIALIIMVNGKLTPNTPTDNDSGSKLAKTNGTAVSAILKLNAGDRVEIFATSSTPGFVESLTFEATASFEAARFPSPS